MKIPKKSSSKFGNKKIIIDGIKFDSKLELYCYNQLKQAKIEFEFQVPYVLQEKFTFNGKAIREIKSIVDFVIHKDGKKIFTDTKGFANDTAPLKYKMLKYRERNNNSDVVWLKNQKEVNTFILKLIGHGI